MSKNLTKKHFSVSRAFSAVFGYISVKGHHRFKTFTVLKSALAKAAKLGPQDPTPTEIMMAVGQHESRISYLIISLFAQALQGFFIN